MSSPGWFAGSLARRIWTTSQRARHCSVLKCIKNRTGLSGSICRVRLVVLLRFKARPRLLGRRRADVASPFKCYEILNVLKGPGRVCRLLVRGSTLWALFPCCPVSPFICAVLNLNSGELQSYKSFCWSHRMLAIRVLYSYSGRTNSKLWFFPPPIFSVLNPKDSSSLGMKTNQV